MDRVRLLKPSSHCVLCDVQCLRKVRKSRGGGHKIKKSLLKEELVLLVQAKYGGRAYTCPPSPWTSYSTGPDVRNEKPPPQRAEGAASQLYSSQVFHAMP